MKLPQMVHVEWDDAWGDTKSVEKNSDYYERPFIMHEVGFLKGRRNGRLVVARTYTAGNDPGDKKSFRDCISIPASCVRKVTKL